MEEVVKMKYSRIEIFFVFMTFVFREVVALSSDSPRLSENNITVVNRNMMTNRNYKVSVESVISLVGRPTSLECDTRVRTGDRIKLVLWFKNNNSIPIYSYDMRSKSRTSGVHWHDKKELQNRVTFHADSSPSRLVIKNSKIEDEGVYRCRIDFNTSPTRISEINLSVIVLPKKPIITESTGNRDQKTGGSNDGPYMEGDSLGPYKEGDHVNLNCTTSGGKPPPSLTWWRNNTLIDKTFNGESAGKVSNILELKNLSRSDLHQTFTCQADNYNNYNTLSTSVKIDMILPPIYVKLFNDKPHLTAGKTHRFMCEVSGSRPPPIIVWTLGPSILKESELQKTSPDGKLTSGYISLVPIKADNGMVLSCHAKTPGLNQTLTRSWTLPITYIPELNMRFGKEVNASHVVEGGNVSFVCQVDANPEPRNITWTHNSEIIKFGNGVTAIGHHLLLEGVDRRFNGAYACSASNTEGQHVSNPLTLDVKCRPHCVVSQKSYEVDLNESVNVTCAVESNGGQVQRFQWTFENNQNIIDIQGSQAELKSIVYTPQTYKDYGRLLCWAENQVGRQNDPCVIQILPAGGASTGLTNCAKQNVKYSTFEIICQPGLSSELPDQIFIVVTDAPTGQVVWSSQSKVGRFFVSGLSPATNYRVFLAFYNQEGQGHKIQLEVATTPDPANPATPATPAPPWTNGLSFVLVLSVIVGVIVCGLAAICVISFAACRQHKRKKAKYDRQINFAAKNLELITTSQQQSLIHCSQSNSSNPPPSPPFPPPIPAFHANPSQQFYSNLSLHKTPSYSSMDSGHGHTTRSTCSSPPFPMPLLHVHNSANNNYQVPVHGSQNVVSMPSYPVSEHEHYSEDNASLSSYSTPFKCTFPHVPSRRAISIHKEFLSGRHRSSNLRNPSNGSRMSKRVPRCSSNNSNGRNRGLNTFNRVGSPNEGYSSTDGGHRSSLTDGGYSSNDGGYLSTYGGYSGTCGGYSGTDGCNSGTDGCNSGTDEGNTGDVQTHKYYTQLETNVDDISKTIMSNN